MNVILTINGKDTAFTERGLKILKQEISKAEKAIHEAKR